MHKTIHDLLFTGALVCLTTLLCLGALGFGVAGVHLLLAAHLPPWAAALLTGAVLLVLALLLAVALRAGRDRPRADPERDRPGRKDAEPDRSAHAEALELALELAGGSRPSAREATLLALVAGTVVGASPELRRQLLSLLTPSADADEEARG